jgi:thymidylate synthase (FAD)
MKVTLLKSDNPVICEVAAKLCTSDKSIKEISSELFNEAIESDNVERSFELLKRVIDMGHTSVAEHASVTFGIEGISRACSHQLVRHRIASYSQQSQRYVTVDNFKYIIPKTLNENQIASYELFMQAAKDYYDSLIHEGVPAEDARFVLPNAAETKLVLTMNLRELMNFLSLRLCRAAQWEIRELAEKMKAAVVAEMPNLAKYFNPKCVLTGYCSEHKKKSCGFKKHKSEIIF